MKKNFKSFLVITLASFTVAGTAFALASNYEPKEATQSLAYDAPQHSLFETINGNFYTIASDAWSEKEGFEDRADLELYLSPLIDDYKSANSDAIKGLVNGIIDAAKYVLKSQIKFIQPVDTPEPREIDITITADVDNRGTIFQELVDAAITGESVLDFDAEYNSYEEAMAGVETYKNSTGAFLKAVLAYMAAKGINDISFDAKLADIESILGITTNEQGEVTNVDLTSEAPAAILGIYEMYNDRNPDYAVDASENAIEDIKTIFNEALDIIDGSIEESMAVAEIFMLMQETKIPIETVIEIIGEETIRQSITDVFVNPEIEVDFIHNALETFTSRTILDLMEQVIFYKEDITDIIDQITSSDADRLLEMTRGLSSEALDNIRIILGRANDNGNKPVETKSFLRKRGIDFGHYDEFGETLVTTVLNNMDLFELFNAVEALWINDSEGNPVLLYSYNYTPYATAENPNPEKVDGRKLYLHNLIDWINDKLPKMSEIRGRNDDEHIEDFHIEVKTPLNENNIWCDLKFGFQNKDCSLIRKVAGYLDDTMDLSFDFIEGEGQDYSKNTLLLDLNIRTPEFFTDAYQFLCSSFPDVFVKNDNRLQEKIFNHVFNMSIQEYKEYLLGLQVETIMEDLKDLDYEVGLNTLLYADKFNAVFYGTNITQSKINSFVNALAKLANKGSSLSMDSIKNILNDILGPGFGNRIDSQQFRNLVEDLYNLFNEIKDQNISVEMLREIQNEDVYGYIDLLSEKADTVYRIRQIVIKFLNALPLELQQSNWMDYYEGIVSGKSVFNLDFEGYEIDWAKVLDCLPLGDKIHTLLSAMIGEEDKLVLGDTCAHIESEDVYCVTYKYEENDIPVTKQGIIGVNAPVLNFGPATIDGKTVAFWVEEGTNNKIERMPNRDIVLTPIFLFSVGISDDLDFTYGSTGALTVTPSSDEFTYTYQWQKAVVNEYGETVFEDVEGETSQSIEFSLVKESGEYRCVVSGDVGDPVVSDVAHVTIHKAVLDISNIEWDYEEPFTYNPFASEIVPFEVKLTNLPEGNGTIYNVNYYKDNGGNQTNKQTYPGQYVALASINLIDEENYELVGDQPDACHWEIISKPSTLYYEFESYETDKKGDKTGYMKLSVGISNEPIFHVNEDKNAFENYEIDYEEFLGTSNGVLNNAYSLEFLGLTIGECTFKVLIPEELRDKEYKVIVSGEGHKAELLTGYTISEDGKYIVFSSQFIDSIGFVSVGPKDTSTEKNKSWLIWIILFGISNIGMLIVEKSTTKERDEKKEGKEEENK